MRLIRPRKTSGFRPTEGKTHPIESTNQITRLGWHQGCPTFRKYPLKYSRSKGIAGSTRPFAFFLSFRTVVPFRNRSIFPRRSGARENHENRPRREDRFERGSISTFARPLVVDSPLSVDAVDPCRAIFFPPLFFSFFLEKRSRGEPWPAAIGRGLSNPGDRG